MPARGGRTAAGAGTEQDDSMGYNLAYKCNCGAYRWADSAHARGERHCIKCGGAFKGTPERMPFYRKGPPAPQVGEGRLQRPMPNRARRGRPAAGRRPRPSPRQRPRRGPPPAALGAHAHHLQGSHREKGTRSTSSRSVGAMPPTSGRCTRPWPGALATTTSCGTRRSRERWR
jgi:hypothetical protein